MCLWPLGSVVTVLIGDVNFVDPAEGRSDVSAGGRLPDRGEMQHAFEANVPTHCKIVALGYSRHQYRDGSISMLSRMDRVWTNLSTDQLHSRVAQATFDSSVMNPNVPRDHPHHCLF